MKNLHNYLVINLIYVFIFLLLASHFSLYASQRPDIYSFNANERGELRDLMMTYIGQLPTTTVNGMVQPYIVNEHLAAMSIAHNNPNNPSMFLIWHRGYIADLESWLLNQDGGSKFVPLPSWDPATTIPNEFFNTASGANAVLQYSASGSTVSDYPALQTQNPYITGWYDFSLYSNPAYLCSFSTLDDFSRDVELEHNLVHVSIGGSMSMVSRASGASIFWLWHAYVDDLYHDYECACMNPSPITTFDYYTRDSYVDNGAEPHATSTWNSPDIWVRNSQDVGLSTQYLSDINKHENPVYGTTNYVYVAIHNNGCTPISDAALHVHWTKANAGAAPWPSNWNNYDIGGLTYGDEITNPLAPPLIPLLEPGESTVIEIPWTPANPADFGESQSHISLLSRIVHPDDPMSMESTPVDMHVGEYVRLNNNVSQKSVTVLNQLFNTIVSGDLRVGGSYNSGNQDMRITFSSVINNVVTQDYLSYGTITVDLGPDLYPLWAASGALGSGITPLTGTSIQINSPDAYIEVMNFNTAQYYTISSTFELLPNITIPEPLSFTFDIIQYETTTGSDVFVGGNSYYIHLTPPCNEEVDAGDNAVIFNGQCETLGYVPATICTTCTYSWSPSTGLDAPNASQTNACPTTTTTYYLTVSDASWGCTTIDSVTIYVDSYCTISAGSDISINQGNCAMIGDPSSNPNATYSWSPISSLSNPNDIQTQACPSSTTTYTLTYSDASGCITTDEVTVYVNPCGTVELGGDINLTQGQCTQLGTSLPPASGMVMYQWSPQYDLNDPYVANPVACPTQTTTYTVIVHNMMTGCVVTDSITLFVDPILDYCDPFSTSNDEWIETVQIENINNTSGDNGGYADFSYQSTLLTQMINYPITLVPGFSGTAYPEVWRIWIDFNHDGIFDSSTELVLDGVMSDQAITENITVPMSALPGSTRMRVQMAWAGTNAESCDVGILGEREDYTVIIVSPNDEYCYAYGYTSDEWIGEVSIADLNNLSGNNNGYGDFTSLTANLGHGHTFDVALTPEFFGTAYEEYWRIWIDYNQDNDFNDPDELVFDAGGTSTTTVTGSFTVPATANIGTTRMRIAMKWTDPIDDADPPMSCDAFGYGEVEDYSVLITPDCFCANDTEAPVIAEVPEEVAVAEAGLCGAVVFYTPPSVTDNCELDTVYCLPPAGSFFPVGVTEVTDVAIDVNGNTTQQTRLIIVEDTESPIITTTPTVTYPVDPNTCGAIVNYPPPTVSDNCTIDTIYSIPPTNSFFDIGATTVTDVAIDASGNMTVTTRTIIVEDLLPPTISIIPDETYYSNPDSCGAIVNFVLPSVWDDCGIDTIYCTPNTGAYFPVGVNVVTTTAVDIAGNMSQQDHIIIVEDSTPPLWLTCPSPIVLNASPTTCAAVATWTVPNASDNCGNVAISSNYNVGDSFNIGTSTVLYDAVDDSGNTSTCAFEVTVENNNIPTINYCPPNQVVSNATNLCEAYVTVPQPTVSPVCEAPTCTNIEIVINLDEFPTETSWDLLDSNGVIVATGDSYDTTQLVIVESLCLTNDSYTFTIYDSFGDGMEAYTCGWGDIDGSYGINNVDDGSVIVPMQAFETPDCNGVPPNGINESTVFNISAPAISTTNVSITNDYNNTAIASDNYPVGTTLVTWTVTDSYGNTNSCTTEIVVEDTETPTFNNCPSNISRYTSNGNCYATATWPTITATDNCANITITGSHGTDLFNTGLTSATFDIGVTTVVYTVADGNGNTATCSFDVNIIDSNLLTVDTCPSDQLVSNAIGLCSAYVNVPVPTIATGCTVSTGGCSNVALTINLDDYPTEITWDIVDVDGNIAANGGSYGASNSQVVENVCLPNNNYTFTIYDSFGDGMQSLSCGFGSVNGTYGLTNLDNGDIIIPLQEFESPDCSSAIEESNIFSINDELILTNSYNNTSNASDTYPVGETLVTWVLTDVYGYYSATCTTTVVVEDTELPVITTIPTTSYPADPYMCGAIVNYAPPTASDNCAIDTVYSIPPAGSYFPIGTSVITDVAVDVNGNITQQTRNIVVEDSTAPIISACPATITVNAAYGACEANVTWNTPSVNDNCGYVSLSSDYTSPSVFELGTTLVTYTATDNVGNTATCAFEVIVVDAEPPTLACAYANVGTPIDACNTSAFVDVTTPVVNDNCGTVTLSNNYTYSANASGNYPVGITTITWTATDDSGNTSTCEHIIIVSNPPPMGTVTLITDDVCDTGNAVVQVVVENGYADVTAFLNNSVVLSENGVVPGTHNFVIELANLYDFTLNVQANFVDNTCSDTQTLSIVNRPVVVTNTNPSCEGIDDGMISLTTSADNPYASVLISGPNAYAENVLFNGNVYTHVLDNLSAGTYTITTTDNLGCSHTQTIDLVANPGITGTLVENTSGYSYFNSYTITVYGTPAYDFDWDTYGYVRYDVDIDPATGVATINIVNTAYATWEVTITDGSGCTGELVYTNLPDPADNSVPEIVSYVSTPDNGYNTGSITITVVGGDAPNTYSWSGPNGFTANSQNIDGLRTGWYSVVVTDADGDTATGWYWVSLATRGRTKDDLISSLSINAYPNPASTETMISFASDVEETLQIGLFAMDGQQVRVVFDGLIMANQTYQFPVEVSNLPAGMYLIMATTPSGQSVQHKLMVTN